MMRKSTTTSVDLKTKDLAMIDTLLSGADWDTAAQLAGFRNKSEDVARLLIDPRALAYAYRKTRGRLTLEGAPAAYRLMVRVMNDENRDMRLRLDIAKHLFAAAGFTPPKAGSAPDPDDDNGNNGVSPKDLERFIAGINAEMERRKAAPITQAIDDII